MRTCKSALVALLALVALPAVGRAATIQTFPIPTPAAGAAHIVAGPDGALWFTETDGYKVGRITTSGQIQEFPVPNGTPGVSGGEGPAAIVSSGGKLWFVTNIGQTLYSVTTGGALSVVGNNSDLDLVALAPSDNGGVWVMPINGGPVGLIGPTGTVTPIPANYDNLLFAAAEAPNGSFWFNNNGSDLYQLTDAGAETAIPVSTTGLNQGANQVSSIAFDRSGNAWFTAYTPNEDLSRACCGKIGEVAGGVAKTVPIGNQHAQVGVAPYSMTRGPDGDMYFAFARTNPNDSGSFNGVGRVDPATGKIQVVDISPYTADEIAFGSDGDLWFVDDKDNLIARASTAALFASALTVGPTGTTTGGGGTGGGTGTGKAPAITLELPAVRISSLRRTGIATVGCKLAGAGRCTVTAAMPATAARKLGLKPSHGAKTVTLSHGSAAAKHAATVTVRLKFGATFLQALGRARGNVKLTITGRSSAAGHTPVTVERTLTLRNY